MHLYFNWFDYPHKNSAKTQLFAPRSVQTIVLIEIYGKPCAPLYTYTFYRRWWINLNVGVVTLRIMFPKATKFLSGSFSNSQIGTKDREKQMQICIGTTLSQCSLQKKKKKTKNNKTRGPINGVNWVRYAITKSTSPHPWKYLFNRRAIGELPRIRPLWKQNSCIKRFFRSPYGMYVLYSELWITTGALSRSVTLSSWI